MHLDDQLQQKINCAGEREEEDVGIYATEVVVTITIPTGELAADTEEIAKNVAKFRAMERVSIQGSGNRTEWTAYVRRIGTA